jgi:hypothetical protein
MALFPAYISKPANIRFREQEADEHIDLFLRRHGITNLPWIIAVVIGYFIPIFAAGFLNSLAASVNFQIPPNLFAGAVLLWYLGLLAFIVDRFLHWYFNIYIVTNKHLVDINLDSLLSSNVVSTQLADIESTKYQFKGVIGGFFRYGNVMVETAAKDQSIEFSDVPNPDLVADRIEDLEGALVTHD